MRPMPVVSVQPNWQLGSPPVRGWIGLGVGPLAQGGLDKALGLAVGLWGIGLGSGVVEAEFAAGVAEGEGFVAGAVVGHDAGHGDAEAGVVGQRGAQEGDGAVGFLVGQDLAEGEARGIVDADMDILPTDAAAVALAGAIAGDAVADAVEAAELFDIDVEQFAEPLTLVAADGFGRFECPQLVEPEALQDPADAGRRDAQFGSDLLAGPALAPQLG